MILKNIPKRKAPKAKYLTNNLFKTYLNVFSSTGLQREVYGRFQNGMVKNAFVLMVTETWAMVK